jgi:hypothetical protein
MLVDKSLRIPMGQVKNASICVGAHMLPIYFIVVDMPTDYSCPIIFGRTFLRIVEAIINLKEETTDLKFGEYKMKFHSSKFQDKPNREELEESKER